MITAPYYLAITAALGVALWLMGSRQWRSCVVIGVGLLITWQWYGWGSPLIVAFVTWAAVAGLTVMLGAPLLASAFLALCALTFWAPILDGDWLRIQTWCANGLGIGSLVALFVGGLGEMRDGRCGDLAVRRADLRSSGALREKDAT